SPRPIDAPARLGPEICRKNGVQADLLTNSATCAIPRISCLGPALYLRTILAPVFILTPPARRARESPCRQDFRIGCNLVDGYGPCSPPRWSSSPRPARGCTRPIS